MLGSSESPLWQAYDVAVLDLDGVVYVGPDAVPGAPGHLERARGAGMHLAYVTNNASRPPGDVAQHLRDLGIEVEDADVVTSAQAAARLLADDLPEGSKVYLIGGGGLDTALRERGLVPVTSPEEEPVAVVQGYGPDMPWRQVVAGAILVHDGLPWVASNTDLTIPTAHGRGPGQRSAGAPGRGFRRTGAGGRGQARAAVVRGDPAAGRRRPPARGRRPARHRHRGRRTTRAGTACWC